MPLIIGTLKKAQSLVTKSCEELKVKYPLLTRRAIVAGVPIPAPIRWIDRHFFKGQLGAYAMCLNHWLPFLPMPVVLINADWLEDSDRLKDRYQKDIETSYHPDCGCPIMYIICHEFAHFIYVNMSAESRQQWEQSYEHAKPSGYSFNPEESFCEAFAGHIAGLTGKYYDEAPRFAADYGNL
ncbi:hypothetical protein [Methanocella sp. MCL-LM]|uniref:hypothetical protein n=1 Tax=Methanocella sp. MCL-LM TaxID=3412035 RepID=UPI003C78B005